MCKNRLSPAEEETIKFLIHRNQDKIPLKSQVCLANKIAQEIDPII